MYIRIRCCHGKEGGSSVSIWTTYWQHSCSVRARRAAALRVRQRVCWRFFFWTHLTDTCWPAAPGLHSHSSCAGAQSRGWNVLVRCTLSPGVGFFHGAAGLRRAAPEERTLGSTSLRRAPHGEDCHRDRSQHRLVLLHLFMSCRQLILGFSIWMWA